VPKCWWKFLCNCECDNQIVDLQGGARCKVYVLDLIRAPIGTTTAISFRFRRAAKAANPLWLAYQAHRANMLWNSLLPEWNGILSAAIAARARSPDGKTIPKIALHPSLHGEIRTPDDPHKFALQYRRPDFFRRRRAGRAVHGELTISTAWVITTRTTQWPISISTTAPPWLPSPSSSVARAAGERFNSDFS